MAPTLLFTLAMRATPYALPYGAGDVMVDTRDRDQAPVVFAIFLIAQVLDALLTYGGVRQLGIDVEMNQLLAEAMRVVGPGAALTVAKLVACVCGYFLYTTARHRTLAIAAGLSIGVAVVPWVMVFPW